MLGSSWPCTKTLKRIMEINPKVTHAEMLPLIRASNFELTILGSFPVLSFERKDDDVRKPDDPPVCHHPYRLWQWLCYGSRNRPVAGCDKVATGCQETRREFACPRVVSRYIRSSRRKQPRISRSNLSFFPASVAQLDRAVAF